MSEALRQAALTLHAMHPDDRQWTLQSLDDRQRDALAPLLDELRELGIPSDPTLLGSLSGAGDARPEPPAGQDGIELDAMPGDVVIAVLKGEPTRYVDLLLRLYPWTWRSAWLSSRVAKASPMVPYTEPQGPSPLNDSIVRHARLACEAHMARMGGATTLASDGGQRPKSLFAVWTQRWFRRGVGARTGRAS
ncbi:hypothetical protein [Pandoraea pnomenusa]|uniref:hypothetical protein n=1 Tax=Pandoraea pnomenusa TaxID=93220 RepID=UPI0011473CF7|nr:hypothetical protein [Pandoraea pnomenusa]QDH60163.1 hypothetical protein FKQ53_13285 [Pandoraea pnomenusa]